MTHAYTPDQTPEAPAVIENITFDELRIGQSAQRRRALTQDDIEAFAAVSGDTNPAHLDPAYADGTPFHGVIAHGMWAGALISAVLGTQLPGPGTIYLEQNLRFVRPVHVGDALTVIVTVLSKEPEKKRVELDCTVSNQHGDTVVFGVALVLAPTRKVSRPGATVPRLLLEEAADRVEG